MHGHPARLVACLALLFCCFTSAIAADDGPIFLDLLPAASVDRNGFLSGGTALDLARRSTRAAVTLKIFVKVKTRTLWKLVKTQTTTTLPLTTTVAKVARPYTTATTTVRPKVYFTSTKTAVVTETATKTIQKRRYLTTSTTSTRTRILTTTLVNTKTKTTRPRVTTTSTNYRTRRATITLPNTINRVATKTKTVTVTATSTKPASSSSTSKVTISYSTASHSTKSSSSASSSSSTPSSSSPDATPSSSSPSSTPSSSSSLSSSPSSSASSSSVPSSSSPSSSVSISSTPTSDDASSITPAPSSDSVSATESDSAPTSSASPTDGVPVIDYRAVPFPFDYYESDPSTFQSNMLDPQNSFRAHFGSKDMQWDDGLVASAQNWADNCGYYSSALSYSSVGWHGENLAAVYSLTTSTLASSYANTAVRSWSSVEYRSYDYNDRPARDDSKTSHFQNIVWRAHDRMGCAVAFCPNGLLTSTGGQATSGYASIFWVCQYGISDPSSVTDWSIEGNIRPWGTSVND